MIVSLIQPNYQGFGPALVPGTGISMQNAHGLTPSRVTRTRPGGKRPFHTGMRACSTPTRRLRRSA
jgi:gamma-glutamyltranspeptidase